MVLTSHYMGDIEELCKRVIIIDHGKIIYDGLLENIVKKHATHKRITVVLEKDIDIKKLAEIGEVKEFDFPRVVFSVERAASNIAAAELLQKFPIADLNIEEPDIEEIIRKVFRGKELV